MGNRLLDLFEESIRSSQGTLIEKLMKNPKKMLTTIVLTPFARGRSRFQLGIKLREKTFWGDEMTLIFPEDVSASILRYGYFEEGLTRMVLEYLKPQMTFCDIGAQIGYFTVLGSYIVGEGGQVHSFEPIPSTFSILRSNVAGRTNVTINNCAVFSKETFVSLNDYGPVYSGYNSLYTARLTPKTLGLLTPHKINVQTISFDYYVKNKHIRPDFIKIDVESAEYEVLCGMEKTLANIRPIVSLEVGDMGIEGVKPSREIIKYLLKRGYEAYEYNGTDIVKHQLRDQYDYDNLLFLPK
jgi:FkbM family methyltransferase